MGQINWNLKEFGHIYRENSKSDLDALQNLEEGQIGYAEDTKKWYKYDGSSWTELSSGGVQNETDPVWNAEKGLYAKLTDLTGKQDDLEMDVILNSGRPETDKLEVVSAHILTSDDLSGGRHIPSLNKDLTDKEYVDENNTSQNNVITDVVQSIQVLETFQQPVLYADATGISGVPTTNQVTFTIPTSRPANTDEILDFILSSGFDIRLKEGETRTIYFDGANQKTVDVSFANGIGNQIILTVNESSGYNIDPTLNIVKVVSNDLLNLDISNLQTKTDNNLQTTSKTIVGGINENTEKLNRALLFDEEFTVTPTKLTRVWEVPQNLSNMNTNGATEGLVQQYYTPAVFHNGVWEGTTLTGSEQVGDTVVGATSGDTITITQLAPSFPPQLANGEMWVKYMADGSISLQINENGKNHLFKNWTNPIPTLNSPYVFKDTTHYKFPDGAESTNDLTSDLISVEKSRTQHYTGGMSRYILTDDIHGDSRSNTHIELSSNSQYNSERIVLSVISNGVNKGELVLDQTGLKYTGSNAQNSFKFRSDGYMEFADSSKSTHTYDAMLKWVDSQTT